MNLDTSVLLTAIQEVHMDAKVKGLKKGIGGGSTISCPICKEGIIHYSVAKVNGHIWARCSTQGYASWIE